MLLSPLTPDHQTDLDRFVASHPLGTIHQSFAWGEFQATAGRRVERLALRADDGKILAAATVVFMPLPLKKFWAYTPRGPVVDFDNPKLNPSVNWGVKFFEQLSQHLKKSGAVFWRFDPPIINSQPRIESQLSSPSPLTQQMSALPLTPKFIQGARPAHAEYQPRDTLLLDLAQTEEELLKQMKEKGRYNIRLAERKGVTVRTSRAPEDVSFFYKLLQETTARDQFAGHKEKYYRALLETLGRDNYTQLFLAEHEGDTIAANIVTFFGDTAIYYYGASGSLKRNLMAPYLLQWAAIREAKQRGCKWYDFLGVAPLHDEYHHLAGVTQFKEKFGGVRREYLPAQEIVFQKAWYGLILAAKRFI